jgi:NAD(P)-dependent dehydrogenase (short-subunit alcohol dehydrogenase family)
MGRAREAGERVRTGNVGDELPLVDAIDVAWAAVYLASDEPRFVTGQVLSPNGGWHMSQ